LRRTPPYSRNAKEVGPEIAIILSRIAKDSESPARIFAMPDHSATEWTKPKMATYFMPRIILLAATGTPFANTAVPKVKKARP
jgi:hypothetical protein